MLYYLCQSTSRICHKNPQDNGCALLWKLKYQWSESNHNCVIAGDLSEVPMLSGAKVTSKVSSDGMALTYWVCGWRNSVQPQLTRLMGLDLWRVPIFSALRMIQFLPCLLLSALTGKTLSLYFWSMSHHLCLIHSPWIPSRPRILQVTCC